MRPGGAGTVESRCAGGEVQNGVEQHDVSPADRPSAQGAETPDKALEKPDESSTLSDATLKEAFQIAREEAAENHRRTEIADRKEALAKATKPDGPIH